MILIAVPCLFSCANLIPDLDWDVESPFGAVGLGREDKALDVVNSSEDPGDRKIDGAVIAQNPEENSGELRETGASLATGTERATLEHGDDSIAEASMPGKSTLGDLESSPSEAASHETDKDSLSASPRLSDPAIEEQVASGATVHVDQDAPNHFDPGFGDTASGDTASGGLDSDGLGPEERIAEAEASLSSADSDSSVGSLDREPTTEGRSPANDQGVLNRGGLSQNSATENDSAALKAHSSAVFSDLGFWFGRPVVTNEGRFGTVLDVRMDITHGAVLGIVVQLSSIDVSGVPAIVFIGIEDLRDGQPWSDVVYFEPVSQATPAPSTSYDELVRLAFAGEEPVVVQGSVLSVETAEVEDGPPVAIVKLRDSENLLHRLDLGQVSWFEGSDELPVKGQEFEVMAVKSRDERGPIWHVASIVNGETLTTIRDSKGAALRRSKGAAPPAAETWSAKKVLGLTVQCRGQASAIADSGEGGEGPEANSDGDSMAGNFVEIGALAGLLMDKDSKQLVYALLRPSFLGDREGVYWPVPIQYLHPRSGAAWDVDLDLTRRNEIPVLLEDQLDALDVPERRAEIDAFWR